MSSFLKDYYVIASLAFYWFVSRLICLPCLIAFRAIASGIVTQEEQGMKKDFVVAYNYNNDDRFQVTLKKNVN